MKDRINYYIFLPLIFLVFFLETAFLPSLLWGFPQPHLVFIILFASIFLSSSADFLYDSFLFGFLFDVYFGGNFGVFTLSVVFSSIFLYFLKEKFLKEESFIRIAGLGMAVMFFYNLIYLCLLSLVFGGGAFNAAVIWKKILFDCVYSVILIFPVMRLISNRKE